MFPTQKEGQAGFALLAALLVIMVISVVALAVVDGAISFGQASTSEYRDSKVFYAAEAGAESAMADLAVAMDDGVLTESEIQGIQPPDLPPFQFDSFGIRSVGEPQTERITDGPFAGLYSLTQHYEIHSEAMDPAGNSGAVAVTVKAQAIPIFQFGVFFEKDLEATNGPAMEFAGWVHSNGNIYLSSNNAWYRDVLTTPNNLYWDRKDNHSVKNGVYVNDASGNEVQLDFDSRSHPDDASFRTQSDAQFDNRVKTGAYGVDTLQVPLPEGVEPHELIRPREATDGPLEHKAKFAWKADWYVEVDLDQMDDDDEQDDADDEDNEALCDGALRFTRDGGQAVPGESQCEQIFSFQWEGFWDGRERRYVDVLDVDVGRLFSWTGGNSTRQTRIFYVTFSGAGRDPSGDGVYPVLRLRQGQNLRNPFTVATSHPLYVDGNYNSAGWQPAGLVGDALMILSNAWNDAQHQAPVVNKTNASRTTVRAAVLAGHSATPCDHEEAGCPGGYADFYGGGIENFPRFLERWSGQWLHYTGSLVSLHEARTAVGTWNGSYYSPPRRDWKFDTRFEDPQNLPPGTPMVGVVMQTAFRPVY